MNHFRARRLLASLPDGTLEPAVETAVRAHAEGCAHCTRRLGEYEAMDDLLRSLPASLVPRADSHAADAAIAALARHAERRREPRWLRLPVHPIGAVATAAALLLGVFLLTPPFEFDTAEPFNAVVLASARRSSEAPVRPRRHSETSRPAAHQQTPESYFLPGAAR